MAGKKRSASKSPAPSQRKKTRTRAGKSSAVHEIKRFPIDDIHKLLETKFPSGDIKSEAAVFLTGVLEYLATEILEMAANVARARQGSSRGTGFKVTLEDIMHATESDPEMKELIDKVRKANANQQQ